MGSFLDLTGKRFEMLLVEKPCNKDKYGNYKWLCKCDCGKEIEVLSGNLVRGNTKSCGCKVSVDLSGKRFEKILVVSKNYTNAKGEIMYNCICDCGKTKIINGSNLRRGHVKSCGSKGCRVGNRTHGMKESDLYKKYAEMKYRCNRNDNEYYGKKGICVCDEWKDFEPFMEWSLKNGYQEGRTLDRISSDGNYEPSNCRWTNRFVQSQNRGVSKNSKTGVRGVYKRGTRFQGTITANGVKYNLGSFPTFELAKEARKQAELEYWGFTNIQD